MTIIRSRSEVAAATTADLLESYNAYTGKSVKRFSSREAAEMQTRNAIMAAENDSGKLGVRKGSKPVAMTLVELEAARNNKARELASAPGKTGPKTAAEHIAKALVQDSTRPKISSSVAREKKARGEARAPARSSKVEFVVVSAGRSKMHEGSVRKSVFDAVCSLAKRQTPVSLATLQDGFKENMRGHVLKLIFEGHLKASDATGKVLAQ